MAGAGKGRSGTKSKRREVAVEVSLAQHATVIVDMALGGQLPLDEWVPLWDQADVVFSPLCLAVQPKYFNCHGATFSADTVRDLLNAAADVNLKHPSTNITAMFLAVKYGDLEIVTSLIDAAADLQVRDHLGRSCLNNATETANEDIVASLLASGVSASERWSEASSPDMNAAEKMLVAHEKGFVSWHLLGPPPVASYVKVFLSLLKEGADLGEIAMWSLSQLLSKSELEVENYLRGNAITRHKVALAKACVGLSYEGFECPRVPEPTVAPPQDSNAGAVRITKNMIARMALAGYGIGEGVHRDEILHGIGRRRKLDYNLRRIIGGPVGRHESGSHAMSLEQLRIECSALHLVQAASGDKRTLAATLDRYDQDAELNPGITRSSDDKHEIRFDTANATNISTKHNFIMSPSLGPVCIPVLANDVPVMAFLSSASVFTVVSTSLANYAGIPYSDTKGDSEVCAANGERFVYEGLVTSLTLTLTQEVKVTLKTAVVSGSFARGLQLGADFFAQAVRSQIDVFPKIDGEQHMCELHHLRDMPHFIAGDKVAARKEVLRYHTTEGTTAVIPLKHCADSIVGTVFFGKDAKVDCCNWCGRAFPGLKHCGVCKETYYCSKACQKAHWPAHKVTCSHS